MTAIKYKIDINTQQHLAASTLLLNDIAFCNLATDAPVCFDAYEQNRRTGCFIVIDRFTNQTVGAGMIAFGLRRGTNVHWQTTADRPRRARSPEAPEAGDRLADRIVGRGQVDDREPDRAATQCGWLPHDDAGW